MFFTCYRRLWCWILFLFSSKSHPVICVFVSLFVNINLSAVLGCQTFWSSEERQEEVVRIPLVKKMVFLPVLRKQLLMLSHVCLATLLSLSPWRLFHSQKAIQAKKMINLWKMFVESFSWYQKCPAFKTDLFGCDTRSLNRFFDFLFTSSQMLFKLGDLLKIMAQIVQRKIGRLQFWCTRHTHGCCISIATQYSCKSRHTSKMFSNNASI